MRKANMWFIDIYAVYYYNNDSKQLLRLSQLSILSLSTIHVTLGTNTLTFIIIMAEGDNCHALLKQGCKITP